MVFGSLAKGESTAGSDVDLMIIGDMLAYHDLYAALEAASHRLGRTVPPTIYTRAELPRRVRQRNAVLTKVLAQPTR